MPLNNEITLSERRLRRSSNNNVEEAIISGNSFFDEPEDTEIRLTFILQERLIEAGAWGLYERSSSGGRQRLLQDISDVKYSSKKEKEGSTLPKGNISLYEDRSIIRKIEECILVNLIGYFLKGDKRLVKDYYDELNWVIVDEQYKSIYKRIFVDIDSEGKLLYNENYTNLNTKSFPRLYNEDTGNSDYIEKSLFNNIKFNDKFEEKIIDGKGIFYKRGTLGSNNKCDKITYRKYKSDTGAFLESIKNIPNTFISTLGKKYQFGVEIESCSGILPQYLDKELYYSAVHDGSLRHDDGNTYGGEYVSDILQGDLGLKQLKKLCFELSKRCLINKKCGVHIHLSGIEFTRENIIIMYYLYYKIQDEIFNMLPKSRRTNEYCRLLDDLNIDINNINPNSRERDFYMEKYYNDIMVFLSSEEATGTLVNKKKDHPKGFKCAYDHRTARYCWANFIPAVFDTRKSSKRVPGLEGHFTNPIQTIEFRPMQASTSYIKIKSWLLICMALVDIVENHKWVIYKSKSINLDLILRTCYPKDGKLLSDYVEARKKKFTDGSSKIELDDYQDNELDNDFKMKNL